LFSAFFSNFDFVTLVKTGLKWVKAEIDAHADKFANVSSVCPFDMGTRGITVMLMREFTKIRKYANKKNGLQKGDEEAFTRRVYLNIYFNSTRRVEEEMAFDEDLIGLKKDIEKGIKAEGLSNAAQNKVKKYLRIKHWGSKVTVSYNESACREAKKYFGYFALVSNCEKDPFECLRKYRKRETIESFFESYKQRTDGTRPRVWDSVTLRGRLFVQFVALCYYEYLSNEVRKIKSSLGEKNGDPVHDAAANIKLEKKLKAWLDNSPIYLVLQWFDAVEGVKVSSKLAAKRWSTEITVRDKLFLDKLGVKLPY
jgi:hypothetical protein